MSMADTRSALFEVQRMLLTMSLIVLPACLANLFAGCSFANVLAASCVWLFLGMMFVRRYCRSPRAIHRFLVFLWPFGRFVSSGAIVFCWFWPIAIPLLLRFNRRLDREIR